MKYLYLILVLFCVKLSYQDDLIGFTIENGQLPDYFKILNRYSSDIDEITNPKYIYGGNETSLNAKWLLRSKMIQPIVQDLIEAGLNFSFISEIERDFNKRVKRDAPNYQADVKIRTLNDCVSRYYDLKQIGEWMAFIRSQYPDLVEIVDIGESTHKRRLLLLKLGYPSKVLKPIFWFDSAIHAREWTTINSVLYSITRILEEQKIPNSPMIDFLSRYDAYFMIVANPDGYEFSLQVDKMWRKNMRDYSETSKCFGVDLNRNFDPNPKIGNTYLCASDYGGSIPASEPETKAIQSFIEANSNRVHSFVSLHAFGCFWILNRDTNNFPNKHDFINMCQKGMFAVNKIKQMSNSDYKFGTPKSLLGYSVGGATDTWAQLRAGAKFAFSIEIGPCDYDKEMLIDGLGFHLKESHIKKVAQTIFDGLYAYISTFLDLVPLDELIELGKFCEAEYENIKKNS